MINRTLCATFAAAVLVLAPAASAAGKTETLRFYSKTDKLTLVKADGTAVQPGPGVEPAPGDRLEIFASDYVGTHRKHAKRATGSEHVVCTFSTAPEPDSIAHVAIGGSMLIFRGFPGTLHRRRRQVPGRDRQGGLQPADPRHQRLRRRGQDQARLTHDPRARLGCREPWMRVRGTYGPGTAPSRCRQGKRWRSSFEWELVEPELPCGS